VSSSIALPEDITMATCEKVAISLREQAAAIDGPIALDAAGLKKFDSSFWSVYVSLRRDTGKTVVINNLPAQLQALGQVYGVWGGSDRH
jgi:ABC-type transporter Mla MlaB component